MLAVEGVLGEVVGLAAEDVLADAHGGECGGGRRGPRSSGDLEIGEAGGAPVDDGFGVDGGAGAGGEVGLDLVLAELGGDGDDGAVEDGGVGLDGVLDLLGGDVLAAAADDILLAVDEIEKAVVVEASHIAGVEPAVLESLAGLVFEAPVAGGDSGIAEEDFAGPAGREVIAVVGGDGDLVVETGVGMLAWLAGGIGAAGCADPFDCAVAALSHAEADDDIGVEAVLKGLEEIGVERGGAVEEADGIVAVEGRFGLLGEDGHHHADEIDDSGLGVADLIPEAGGGKAVLDDEGGTGGESAHGGIVLGVGVEKGEAGEKAVVTGGLGPVGKTLAGGDVHLVSEHDALGVAGGAGGVDEHGDVVGRD